MEGSGRVLCSEIQIDFFCFTNKRLRFFTSLRVSFAVSIVPFATLLGDDSFGGGREEEGPVVLQNERVPPLIILGRVCSLCIKML